MPRGVHGGHVRGAKHYAWKPGGKLAANGYVRLRLGRGHPLADPNGYGYEHVVVWVSAGNPRPGRDEILHHVNGDKTDNRIGNLALMKRGHHNAHHLAEQPRRCPKTGRLLPVAAGAMLDGREWREVPA